MLDSPVTGYDIINRALIDIGAQARGQTVPAVVAQEMLARLNGMLGQWAIQTGTIPFVQRQVFPLTSNKGGPDNPYTWGLGGDFNTERPGIPPTGAGIVMPGSPSPQNDVEIPRALITDDMFQMNQLKQLQNTLATFVYYNGTYQGNLASVILWPVPTINTNSLALYWPQQIGSFANLTTQYYLPPGYALAMEFNLAVVAAPSMQRSLQEYADVMKMAVQSLAIIGRNNVKMSDVPQDIAITHDRRGGYNILTGTGG